LLLGSLIVVICLLFMRTSVLWQLVAHGNGCIKNPSDFVIRWRGRHVIVDIR
jgi:hypothetical protein